MPRMMYIFLLATALLLPPAWAGGAELVLHNTSTGPVTVSVISPCGKGGTSLVQVARDSSTKWDQPSCPPPAQAKDQLRLAVFDHRTDQPGFIAMLIAAKADVKLPAKVIISRQYCEECDTRYNIQWIPLKGGS